MVQNPVMFVVEVGSVLDTPLRADPSVFAGLIALWLWFTVLFANFAEAMAEGRGKAQAAPCEGRAPRRSRTSATGRRTTRLPSSAHRTATWSSSRPAR